MSEDKIVELFPGNPRVTYDRIPPERVINAALEASLAEVLILGWTEDGRFYISSSEGYTPDLLAMCELGKHNLLSSYEE